MYVYYVYNLYVSMCLNTEKRQIHKSLNLSVMLD